MRGTTVRGAGLLLFRVDRLVAGDFVWGGDRREGGLLLLVTVCEGAGEASFRRLAAGGFAEVGEGVGRVFVAEGGLVTTLEFWTTRVVVVVVVVVECAAFPDRL